MTNDQLYLAISELISDSSKENECRMNMFEKRINHRMDTLENSMNHRMDTLETKFDTLETKFDTLETKFDTLERKFDALETKVDALDGKIDGVEESLSGQIHAINLKIENIIEPRLKHIEQCYVATSERYQENVEKMDRIQLDIEVLKSVVRKHDEILSAMPA